MQKENKMGTMPIGKLLIVMSVPMMISMFIQALYNAVDSMFVAQIEENALTAVSLAFPVQSIMAALGVGTGVGCNALISRLLGQKQREKAEKAANVQIFLSACYTILFVFVGIFFARKFYVSQTDVEDIIDYGTEYLSIVCIFGIGGFYGQNFEKTLISIGESTKSMISQASGAIINIILDPICIFALHMGVRGAAVATVIGQACAALIALYFHIRYNQETRFHFKKMLPDWESIKEIYSVGLPSILTVSLPSIMGFSMNQIMLSFSTTAAAVYGVWGKLMSFGFMPVFGMNNGTIAIYSYNFGAKNYDRVRQTLKLSLTMGTGITAAILLIYELFPRFFMGFFNPTDYMMSLGVPAIRICSFAMLLGAINIIMSSSCQSLRFARYSFFINLCRQILLALPLAFLFSLTRNINMVWLALVVAEVIAFFIAFFMTRKVFKTLEVPKDGN